MKSNQTPPLLSHFVVFLSLFVVFTILHGCTYKMDEEYFRNISPPVENYPFELTLDVEGDTILIVYPTNLFLELKTDSLKVLEMNVYINDSLIANGSIEYKYLRIEPTKYEPGFYTLSAQFITTTGTGSIADNLHAEVYVVERTWVLAIKMFPTHYPEPTCFIDADGYLKVRWNKFDRYGFKYYQIGILDGYVEREYIITDPNVTEITDSCFVFGEVKASVKTFLTNNQAQEESFSETFTLAQTVNFFELNPDSLLISWKSGAGNSVHTLIMNEEAILENTSDTSFIIEMPPLGIGNTFYLRSRSSSESCEASTIHTKYAHYESGVFVADHKSLYAFNEIDETVYSIKIINDFEIVAIDVHSLDIVNSLHINNIHSPGAFCSQYNSTKFAAFGRFGIYVFDNNQLSESVFLSNLYDYQFIDHFYFTINSKIAFVQDGTYKLLDIENPEDLITLELNVPGNTFYTYPWIGTHKNGSFVSVINNNKLKHYSISNHEFTLLLESDNTYNSLLYSENDPVCMLLSSPSNNDVEIRDPQTFELIDILRLQQPMVLRNIDPATGYLLMKDDLFIYIINPANGNELMKMRSDDPRPNLFDSKLFMQSGYCFDLERFLP